jgi:hypothetical protein
VQGLPWSEDATDALSVFALYQLESTDCGWAIAGRRAVWVWEVLELELDGGPLVSLAEAEAMSWRAVAVPTSTHRTSTSLDAPRL